MRLSGYVLYIIKMQWNQSQWTYGAMITSLLRQNEVETSFWHNNDVTIAPYVRWGGAVRHNPTRNKPTTKTAYRQQTFWIQSAQITTRILIVCFPAVLIVYINDYTCTTHN